MTEPLFGRPVVERLREAVGTHFGSRAVADTLGLAGEAALSRADLSGAGRVTRGGSPTETLIRLFLLGRDVSATAAAAALAPLAVADAVAAGLLTPAGDRVRAALDLRPYSEAGGPDWWVLSDLGAEVRPGALDTEHVLGVGSAATTLADATVRTPVRRALDVGTGSGLQALHLSRHSTHVTATDLSRRALRFAATTAALNGVHWDLRQGSLLEPVADELFDLIVCNPPFIVGPGFTPDAGGYTYRDSGMAGDSVCQRLVGALPDRLTDGGTAQLLANWAIDGDRSWAEHVSGWLPGTGCEAWIWQREVADPGEYVSLWLRDAGEVPNTPAWREKYDRWLDWFADAGVIGVGMGLISVRRTPGVRSRAVCEDVPQAYERPVGPQITSWFDRRAWLHRSGPDGLLAARLRAADGLVRSAQSVVTPEGWESALLQIRQSHGLRWELEVDETVAGLVAACTGEVPLGTVLELISSVVDAPAEQVVEALAPVVRDLIERGFLLPPDLD